MRAWKWAMEYGVAIGLTFLFAMILGQIPLFRETAVGRLRASDLVQFLGYSGSLTIMWLSARRLADDLPEEWKRLAPFKALILPLATLITAALSYSVLLLVCQPFLSKAAKGVYNWMFIVVIVSSAAWLILSWIRKCAPIMAAAESRKLRKAA